MQTGWKLIPVSLCLCGFLCLGASVAYAQEPGAYVYQIEAFECRHPPHSRRLTGFRVQGIDGIITALHGVADCDVMVADSSVSGVRTVRNLVRVAIDINHDVAWLHSPELPDDGQGLPAGGTSNADEQIYVIGHPYGLTTQLRSGQGKMVLRSPAYSELAALIPFTQTRILLNERQSPHLTSRVLSIDGTLVPGHSGAPIFNSNGQVIGVGNGGLVGGSTDMVWAIPWTDLCWQPMTVLTDTTQLNQDCWESLADFDERLSLLDRVGPHAVFAFDPEPGAGLASAWLPLLVRIIPRTGATLELYQPILTTERGRYVLALPPGTADAGADISILTLDASATIPRVLAYGQVNGAPLTSVQGCGADYNFQVATNAGDLWLDVEPRLLGESPGGLSMRGCIYKGGTMPPAAVTEATVTAMAVATAAVTTSQTLFASTSTDSDGLYVLTGIDPVWDQRYARIRVSAIGYEPYTGTIQVAQSQLPDFFLTPTPAVPVETIQISPALELDLDEFNIAIAQFRIPRSVTDTAEIPATTLAALKQHASYFPETMTALLRASGLKPTPIGPDQVTIAASATVSEIEVAAIEKGLNLVVYGAIRRAATTDVEAYEIQPVFIFVNDPTTQRAGEAISAYALGRPIPYRPGNPADLLPAAQKLAQRIQSLRALIEGLSIYERGDLDSYQRAADLFCPRADDPGAGGASRWAWIALLILWSRQSHDGQSAFGASNRAGSGATRDR